MWREPRPTKDPLHVSPQSVFMLGAAAGGLSTMFLNDCLGRKLSIMFSALPSALGYALMAGAQGIGLLLLGRVLTGYAGGVTSASIPVTCRGREFVGYLCRAVPQLNLVIPLLPGGASRAPGLWLGDWGWGGCTGLTALALYSTFLPAEKGRQSPPSLPCSSQQLFLAVFTKR